MNEPKDNTDTTALIEMYIKNSIRIARMLQKEGGTEERRKFLLETQLAELVRAAMRIEKLRL